MISPCCDPPHLQLVSRLSPGFVFQSDCKTFRVPLPKSDFQKESYGGGTPRLSLHRFDFSSVECPQFAPDFLFPLWSSSFFRVSLWILALAFGNFMVLLTVFVNPRRLVHLHPPFYCKSLPYCGQPLVRRVVSLCSDVTYLLQPCQFPLFAFWPW